MDATFQSRLSDWDAPHPDKFQLLIKKSSNYRYKQRLDSIPYTYAFIKQVYRDYNPHKLEIIPGFGDPTDTIPYPVDVTEIYFLGNDTIPSIVYLNGKIGNNKEYVQNLNKLLGKYQSYKPEQVVEYSKIQEYSSGCISYKNEKANATEKRKEQMRNTYQIMTYSDSKKQLTKTSLQYPPTNPDFIIKITHGF